MEIPGLDPAAPNRFMKVPVWAFKMYWIRSGKICTAVGSSGHYIRMFPAGPEVTTPDVIALRGAVWDEIQFYPGFPDTSTTSRTTTSYELSCWLSPQSRMDRDIAFFQRPRMTEVRIPVSRLHKARFLFGKGAVLDGKLTSSSCCTCTYLQLFNAIPRLAKKRVRINSFDPVYPKPKGRETSRAPKRAEICDSYTVLHL